MRRQIHITENFFKDPAELYTPSDSVFLETGGDDALPRYVYSFYPMARFAAFDDCEALWLVKVAETVLPNETSQVAFLVLKKGIYSVRFWSWSYNPQQANFITYQIGKAEDLDKIKIYKRAMFRLHKEFGDLVKTPDPVPMEYQ